MLKKYLSIFFVLLAVSCGKDSNPDPQPTPPDPPTPPTPTKGWENTGVYEMSNGTISEECLKNYLSRAITESEYLHSAKYNQDGFYGKEDDTRMLKNVGAKFIGRSLYHWGRDERLGSKYDAMWSQAKEKIDAYHQYDKDAIFEACIFEIVSIGINQVPIPGWVFEAFGLPVETRNFNYDNIRNKSGAYLNQWGNNTAVPDISNTEAQMYFYFQAVKYMELGIEALHLGQVELMAGTGMGAGCDSKNNYAGWKRTTELIHKAALTKARRGTVLLDGHLTSGGIIVEGRSLFDFISYPLRLKENTSGGTTYEYDASLAKNYRTSMIGRTKAGVTPSGWFANRLPYILEFDNFGTSDHPGISRMDDFVWGYDEISWFANVPYGYAKQWLVTNTDYLNDLDDGKEGKIGFIQMPGLRVAVGRKPRATSWGNIYGSVFRCNTPSEDCKEGMDLEDTIKTLWK